MGIGHRNLHIDVEDDDANSRDSTRNADQIERLAALDLHDKEAVQEPRSRQIIDKVIRVAMEKLSEQDDFWKRVKLDQMGGHRQDQGIRSMFRLWRTRESQVGICDEMGIANVRIKTAHGLEERLVPQAHPSEPLYGGTLCARMGIETTCAQFVVPLGYATEKYESDADLWDSSRLRLYTPSSMHDGKPARNLDIKRAIAVEEVSPGHRFFFQTFLSVIFANEEGTECSLSDVGLSPGEKCGDKTTHVCAEPHWERDAQGVKFRSGVACGTVQIAGDDLSYAQRFVDPDTCNDLVRAYVRGSEHDDDRGGTLRTHMAKMSEDFQAKRHAMSQLLKKKTNIPGKERGKR